MDASKVCLSLVFPLEVSFIVMVIAIRDLWKGFFLLWMSKTTHSTYIYIYIYKTKSLKQYHHSKVTPHWKSNLILRGKSRVSLPSWLTQFSVFYHYAPLSHTLSMEQLQVYRQFETISGRSIRMLNFTLVSSRDSVDEEDSMEINCSWSSCRMKIVWWLSDCTRVEDQRWTTQ